MVGDTKPELGGSEYYRLMGIRAGIVPRTDPGVLKTRMAALREAMTAGLIASCHDVSEGGLAVAICEMLMGGDLGAEIEIAGVNVNPGLRSDYKLFSESNTRWIVEVWRDERERFEMLMRNRGVGVGAGAEVTKIGETKDDDVVIIRDGGKKLLEEPLAELRAIWRGEGERGIE